MYIPMRAWLSCSSREELRVFKTVEILVVKAIPYMCEKRMQMLEDCSLSILRRPPGVYLATCVGHGYFGFDIDRV